jgi:hypothetical protein
MRALGALLVLLGVVALVFGGFTYTKREKVFDAGRFEATVDRDEYVHLPPAAGAAALVAGAFLIALRRRHA